MTYFAKVFFDKVSIRIFNQILTVTDTTSLVVYQVDYASRYSKLQRVIKVVWISSY